MNWLHRFQFPSIDAQSARIVVSIILLHAAILSFSALPTLAARGSAEFIMLAISAALVLLCAAAMPERTPLRMLAAALFLTLEIVVSGDPAKMDQRPLFLIYAVVIFALTATERLPEGILAARLTILATYLMAGITKLIGFVIGCTHAACTTTLISAIYATNAVETGREGVLTAFMVGHPLLSLSTYIIAMLFQLVVLFLYLYDIGRKWIPLELIAFHLAVYLVMGIDFFDNIILIFVLFIFANALNHRSTHR
jgi:hypothetical protein